MLAHTDVCLALYQTELHAVEMATARKDLNLRPLGPDNPRATTRALKKSHGYIDRGLESTISIGNQPPSDPWLER